MVVWLYKFLNLTQCHTQSQPPRPLSSGLPLSLTEFSIFSPSCPNLHVCCSPILHKSIGSTFYTYQVSTHFSPHSLLHSILTAHFQFADLPTHSTPLSPYIPSSFFIFITPTPPEIFLLVGWLVGRCIICPPTRI